MRKYEVVVVLSPMLNQDQAAETWDRVKDFITNRNGQIDHEEKWGARRLAFPIRKTGHNFLEGTYYFSRFSAERPFNQEFEAFLKVHDQVLRSLIATALPPRPASPVAAKVPEAAVGVTEVAPEAVAVPAEGPPEPATADAPTEPATAEAPAPKRVSRRKIGETRAEAGPIAEPVAEAAGDEAPTPPRKRATSRRKTEETTADAGLVAEPAVEAGDDDAPVPPRKRASSRAKAEETTAEAGPVVEPAAEAGGDEAPTPPRKRATSRRKAQEEAEPQREASEDNV